MSLADYLRGSHHLHHFSHMFLLHLADHRRRAVLDSLRNVRQLALNYARCTQERIVFQELIVAMQQRILEIQLLLLVEDCRVNIRIDEKEAADLVLAHTHNHKKLLMVDAVEFRQQDVATTYL